MPSSDPNPVPLRRPLLGVALAYMAGIWLGVICSGQPVPLAWIFDVALWMLILALGLDLTRRRAGARLAAPAFFLAVLCTAWFGVSLRLADPSACSLAALLARDAPRADKPSASVELIGVVSDDPARRQSWKSDREVWSFPIRLECIRRLDQWQEARGTVAVTLPAAAGAPAPRYGERWRFAGALEDRLKRTEGESGFRDRIDNYRRRFRLRADETDAKFIEGHRGFFLIEWCFKARGKCGDILARGIEHRPDVVGLMQALLLGFRQELPEQWRRDFIATGTYHIFAISGQHVAILAMFVIVVIQARRVCRTRWFYFVAPVLVLFTLATGLSASAVRGCAMALLCFLGPLVGRKTDLPSALALAALLILAVDPLQLFDYGFILSFVAVAGLIAFCPPLLRFFERLIAPDPLRLQPERPVVRANRVALRFGALLVASSLAAWLVSTPLIARWFNLVSPVAVLANLIVIPLTTLVMLSGCLAIVTGMIAPAIGEIFNFASVALVTLLAWISGLMARIPGGNFYMPAPLLWSVAAWFALLPAVFFAQVRLRWRLVMALAVVLTLAVGEFAFREKPLFEVINCGPAPVCLVRSAGGDLLINAGARFNSRRLERQLRRRGVNRLAALVLAVADEPHCGGARELLAYIPAREVWCASTNLRSTAFQTALDEARRRGSKIRCLQAGYDGRIRGGMDWAVLAPAPAPGFRSAEEAAISLRIERDGVAAMLMFGPPDRWGAAAVPGGKVLKADILVMDGFDDDLEDYPLIETVRPSFSLFCPSRGNAGQFDPSTRVEAGMSKIVSIQPGESARVIRGPKGIEVKTAGIDGAGD